MVIDVRGVNTHNKGAELMMIAIADRFRDLPLATSPNGSSYDVRARLGYKQTFAFNQAPVASSIVGNRLPERLRSQFGLASLSEITGVIDAAGYAYGDSFSPTRARREERLAELWRKRNVPRVFMPQAFGPFSNRDVAKWSKRLLRDATIVYARDRQSMEFLTDLCPDIEIKQCVDFTIGLDGVRPELSASDYGVVVPNSKMYTHSDLSRVEYVDLNVRCAYAISAAGLQPIVMSHESTDRDLAAEIAMRSGAVSFWDPSPLVLKGLIKGAAVTVGSRYHALVGSLSSGKPTVALGWSHKYEELFADFGVPDWVARDLQSAPDLIENVVDDVTGLAELQRWLKVRKEQVDAMWADVEAIVAKSEKE